MNRAETFKEAGHDTLPELFGGSVTIIGSPINLDIDYSLDLSTETLTINVTLAGVSIGSATLSSANACAKFSHSLKVVKASIEVCFDWNNNTMTVSGDACYYSPFSWHCSSIDTTINV